MGYWVVSGVLGFRVFLVLLGALSWVLEQFCVFSGVLRRFGGFEDQKNDTRLLNRPVLLKIFLRTSFCKHSLLSY